MSSGLVQIGRRPPRTGSVDLLRWPILGRLLKHRRARTIIQAPLLMLAVALVAHGLWGPPLAPKNLATVLIWVHYRGLLVIALLALGNVFCLGCPFIAARDRLRRWLTPRWSWPKPLRSKWAAVVLFAAVLFAYELFDWWSSPRTTALVIVSYFVAALLVDTLFTRASFCKYLCPIGQFNFVASTVSPLEVRARDAAVCSRCAGKECLRGRGRPGQPDAVRGCEMGLLLPRKAGNLDCTFCLDCVHACPSDNVGLVLRAPAAELAEDCFRSGIGRLSRRPDFAALIVLFVFGSLMNAFAMVRPVYAVERWLAAALHTQSEAPVLAVLFAGGLLAGPAVLLGVAAWLTRSAAGHTDTWLATLARYSQTLIPVGFAIWIAHYAFHFLTGLLTFVPVVQRTIADLGVPLLGQPRWRLGGLPVTSVHPIQMGVLLFGLVGSWAVAWRTAERAAPRATVRAFLPWAALVLALFSAASWLFAQPMEMRSTFLQ